MKCNWFILVAGLLYLGAAWHYWHTNQFKLAGAFVAYAAANFFLSFVKEGV